MADNAVIAKEDINNHLNDSVVVYVQQPQKKDTHQISGVLKKTFSTVFTLEIQNEQQVKEIVSYSFDELENGNLSLKLN